ncbi:GntR family transcriptional regulator [Streptomyces vinaceus]|uniref:GntR family transcriptional regulator n=1 Tax=Streptomyces vinaceus TaxID=1960 RepID=UPI00367FD525
MPSPSPRGTYQVISQVLRQRIAAGEYADGLPSEAEIGREFGVARTTVRRALRALEETGAVKSVAGVGRTVAGGAESPPYERIMNDLLGQIQREELPTGTRLPSEAALAERVCPATGVSRVV